MFIESSDVYMKKILMDFKKLEVVSYMCELKYNHQSLGSIIIDLVRNPSILTGFAWRVCGRERVCVAYAAAAIS